MIAVTLGAGPATQKSSNDAEIWVHKTFAAEYRSRRSEDRVLLARLLMEKAKEQASEPARQLAIWREAEEMAAQAGEVELACTAAAQQARGDAAESLRLRGEAFAKLSGHLVTNQSAHVFVESCMNYADEAVTAQREARAEKAMTLASAAAPMAHDAKLATHMREKIVYVEQRLREAQSLERAEHQLAIDPSDPKANLIVGRHRCFALREWKSGLPLLEKCGDSALELAAKREKAMHQSTDAIAVADAWWEVAMRETGPARVVCQARATRFYEQAFPVIWGDDRKRAEQRMLTVTNSGGDSSRTFADDPQALWALLGPERSATGKAMEFQKFYVRTDNAKLKHLYGILQASLSVSAAIGDARVRTRLRVFCQDERGNGHVLENWRALKVDPGESIKITGPEADAVKARNSMAWCPHNAHLAVFIDNVMIWQGLWRVPESSCWWLDESLVGK